MKRYGYLYDKVCDKENIKLAIKNASKGKRNRKNVKKILDNADYYADVLSELLIKKEYKPSPYNVFTIYDTCSRKEREIFAPRFFPDQVIHWAVMQVIQPYIENPMYHLSCASRKYKGMHYGKKYIERWLRNDKRHTKYCLKLDIKKFYPSIDQEKLKELLRRKFKDRDLLELLYQIIGSTESGVPIGNYTSQWFANFYLTPFDHFVKEVLKAKYYIRYMDDVVIIGGNKRELHRIKSGIEKYLAAYKLQIKGNWQIFRIDDRGVDFLGFRFFHHKTIIRKRTALKIRRCVKRKLTYHTACTIISYLGWLKYADMYWFTIKYVKPYVDIKKAKEVIRHENKFSRNAHCAV